MDFGNSSPPPPPKTRTMYGLHGNSIVRERERDRERERGRESESERSKRALVTSKRTTILAIESFTKMIEDDRGMTIGNERVLVLGTSYRKN